MLVTISGFYDEVSQNLDEQIALVRELGEKYICPRRIDGKNIADYTASEFQAKIKPRLDAAGIGFSSIGSPIGKVNVNDEEGFKRQLVQLKELVNIAASMNCKYIRIFSFFIPKGAEHSRYRDAVIGKMKKFVECVEGTDVILLHENEKGIYGDTLARVQKLHAAVPGLRCVFDPANYIQCGDDPAVNFKALAPMIDYMHVKDALFADGSVVPAGEGDGSVPQILAALAETGKPYILTIEPHLFDFNGLSALQDEELTHKRVYRSGEEAFDAAADALHAICEKINL